MINFYEAKPKHFHLVVDGIVTGITIIHDAKYRDWTVQAPSLDRQAVADNVVPGFRTLKIAKQHAEELHIQRMSHVAMAHVMAIMYGMTL